MRGLTSTCSTHAHCPWGSRCPSSSTKRTSIAASSRPCASRLTQSIAEVVKLLGGQSQLRTYTVFFGLSSHFNSLSRVLRGLFDFSLVDTLPLTHGNRALLERHGVN